MRTNLRLLLTSILSIVFGAVGVVVGLLAEVIAGVLRIFWAIVLYVLSNADTTKWTISSSICMKPTSTAIIRN